MGLIKKAVFAGAVLTIANKGIKAYEDKRNHSQSQQQQQQQYSRPTYRDYPHQSWCNGQCAGHCNDYNTMGSYAALPATQQSSREFAAVGGSVGQEKMAQPVY